MDNVVRGAKDVDLSELEEAARKTALFEEKLIYHGLPEVNITGLKVCSGGECLTIGSKPEQLLQGIAEGVTESCTFRVLEPQAVLNFTAKT